MHRKSSIVAVLGVLLPLAASSARAAELTDVVDSLDEEFDNPFDFHFEPEFRQRIERGIVARESGCDPGVTPDRCSDPATIFNRELDYKRVISSLDLTSEIGLYTNLELHLVLPIVLSDTRTLTYANDVSEQNSTIDPSNEAIERDLASGASDPLGEFFGTYRFFEVGGGNQGPHRSGVGDLTLGIAWAPFDDDRDQFVSTLAIGFDYIIPTGQPARGSNRSVGNGVHELQFWVAASRHFFFLDPYFGLRYGLPLPAQAGLFEDLSSAQTLVAPGMHGRIDAGTELVMFEDEESGQTYVFDVGMHFGYRSEGRDYTALFDALASSSCNARSPASVGITNLDGSPYQPDPSVGRDNATCAWVVQQPSNEDRTPGTPALDVAYSHDGITDVEGYSSIGGHAGFNLQFSRYVELRLRTEFETESQHFITSARTGKDFGGPDDNGNVSVDLNPAENERNPYYNPTIDGIGARLRLEGIFNFTWGATLAFQF